MQVTLGFLCKLCYDVIDGDVLQVTSGAIPVEVSRACSSLKMTIPVTVCAEVCLAVV